MRVVAHGRAHVISLDHANESQHSQGFQDANARRTEERRCLGSSHFALGMGGGYGILKSRSLPPPRGAKKNLTPFHGPESMGSWQFGG